MRDFVQWALVLGVGGVGQTYIALEAAVQGAQAPRWLFMAATTLSLIVSVVGNLLAATITPETKSGAVAQLAERSFSKAHQPHLSAVEGRPTVQALVALATSEGARSAAVKTIRTWLVLRRRGLSLYAVARGWS